MDNNYLEHYNPIKKWKKKFNNAINEVNRLKNELMKKQMLLII
jgi:hypothetical protein